MMKCSECEQFIKSNEKCKICDVGNNSAVKFWNRHKDDKVDFDIKDGDCLYFSKPKENKTVEGQVFIRVEGKDGNKYDKDINESTEKERYKWYERLSKGQVISLFEDARGFKK